VKKNKEPYTEGLKKILGYCLEKGLVLIKSGVDRNIIRLAPPLIVTKEEMDRGLDILEEACRNSSPCKPPKSRRSDKDALRRRP